MTIHWMLLQLRNHKLLTTATVLLGTCTVLASMGLLSTSGYLISRAALRPPILDLMLAIVAVRFFGIGRAAVRYGERVVSHDLTFRLLLRLRCWLYQRLEPIIPSQRINYHSGDLLSRLISDVETMQNLYLRLVSPVVVAAMVGATATAIVWFLTPAAALILFTGLVLTGVALPLTVLFLGRKSARRQVRVRAALQTHLIDSLGGMEETVALGIEGLRREEHDRMTRELARLQERQAWIGAFREFLSCLLIWSTVIGVLIVSIPKVQSGELSGLLLAAAAFGVLASFEAVQILPPAYQYLEQSREASGRIDEIVRQDACITTPVHPKRIPDDLSFRFQNVSFTFPGALRPALSEVSFDLPFGTRTAIVGASGAGKSTIVSLLCRFFDPKEGRVQLGGDSLRDYDVRDLRAQLAVVMQNPHIFNTSIRENLLLARPEATESELADVLELVGLGPLVRNSPNGLGTNAGSEGLKLSGGERQRLALAQVLLKRAPVLILDEATANLDLETEREILEAVYTFTTNRTLLVITHRPENLSRMDEILYLQDGRLQLQRLNCVMNN